MQKEINWLLQEKYQSKPTEQFKKDAKRLRVGEPLDYVIGFTEFLGCKIDLSKKVLIPRFETEFWAEKAIEDVYYKSRTFGNSSIRVLDIFAGSGCIGLAVLKHVKNSFVVFADSEEEAIDQIKINTKLNKVARDRFKIIKSDILDGTGAKFDVILANPPYIPVERKHKVQSPVIQFEPHAALFGGGDGLFFIKKFLASAKNFLNPGGKIYMEFDTIQEKSIERIIKKYRYKKYEFRKDQYGKWRYVVIE